MGISHLKKKVSFFHFDCPIFHSLYSGVPFEVIIYHVPTENIRNIAIFAGRKICVYFVVCLGLNISKIKKRIVILLGCKNVSILRKFIYFIVNSNPLCPVIWN